MAPELLRPGPDPADELHLLRLDGPGHGRDVLGHAAIDLPLEVLDDLRPPDLPPLPGGGHLPARLRPEDLRKHGEGIGLALIVIGGVRAALVRIEPAPDGLDAELVEHVLMVLFGRERDRSLGIGRRTEQASGEQCEDLFHIGRFNVSEIPRVRGDAADAGARLVHVAQDAADAQRVGALVVVFAVRRQGVDAHQL